MVWWHLISPKPLTLLYQIIGTSQPHTLLTRPWLFISISWIISISLWKPEYFQCSHLSIFYYIIYVDVIHILIAANDRWYWDFKVYSITRLHVSRIFCQSLSVLVCEPLTCACRCGACKCMCPVSGIIIIISHVSSDHNLPKHQGTPTWTLKLSRT